MGDGSSSVPSVMPTPCFIVIGMAGVGKTSFVQRLSTYLRENGKIPYLINLDPAVSDVPYPANVDIRDTVNYKEIMRQYNLGPNGAIMTCLNLLCTRFEQVLELLKKRSDSCSCFIFDTPGQIEAFTWSASGSIITNSLAVTHPTVIVFVMDSIRVVNPTTFMSNLLYACSILYRTKLPFLIVVNKADVVDPQFVTKWLKDFESYQEALSEETSSYKTDLTRSLSLILDKFYEHLDPIPVSSLTGEGMDKFIPASEKAIKEYYEIYRPMLEKRIKKQGESSKPLVEANFEAELTETTTDIESLIINETKFIAESSTNSNKNNNS